MANAPAASAEQDDLDELFDDDARPAGGKSLTAIEASALATLTTSEIQAQVDVAKKYPRDVKGALRDTLALATLKREIAKSCLYAIPRDGKLIAGPSVRLAEILATQWGNLHVAVRLLEPEQTRVVVQAFAWDLQRNTKIGVEVARRITGKKGRFSDDMVGVTAMAAGSIAFRNAVFRIVPRAYVDEIYARVRKVAVGTAKTLEENRARVVAELRKTGVPDARILARIGKTRVEEIGLDELELLIGLGTAIQSGDRSIDEAFPVPDDTAAKAKGLEEQIASGAPSPAAGTSKPGKEG